jgi:HK97 family phage prohead protease
MYEKKDAGLGKVEDVDTTGRRIILYAASFDTLDSHSDIIRKGAFTKTIAENLRVKHLWQHDGDKPVGKPESMVEDHKGLLITSKISDTQLGRDLLTLVADGVMSENSIGFQTIKSQKDEQKSARIIQEIKLWEYSSVTWGSNENTPNMGVKSLTPREQSVHLFAEFKKIQNLVRKGNFHDDTYALLEIKLVQIEADMQRLMDKSLATKKEPEAKSTSEVVVEPVQVKAEYDALTAFYKAMKS